MPISNGPDNHPGSDNNYEGEAPTSIFIPLLNEQLPDVLDRLIWEGRPSNPEATPLERHLSRQLSMAHADQIRSICAKTDIDVARLKTSGNFWLRFNANNVTPKEKQLLLGVEAAINRSFAAADIAENKGMSLSEITDEKAEEYSEIPYMLEFANPKEYFENSTQENPFITYYGARGKQGGEWDIRTRLSNMLESRRLPARLEYGYDVNLEHGYIALEFSVPSEDQFPSTKYDEQYRAVSIAGTVPDQRALYMVKLAIILASMCFGASVGITKVDIIGRDENLGGYPVLTYRTTRFAFNSQVVKPMADEELRIDLSPLKTAREFKGALGLTGMNYKQDEQGHLERIEPLALDLKQPIPLWEDERDLPEKVKALLFADKASELDIYHDGHPELLEELHNLREQNKDSVIVSIMAIEEFLSRIDTICEPALGAKEGIERIPLYCANPIQRLLIEHTEPHADTRYVKIPDAAFNARCLLSDLYMKLGEPERAIEAYNDLIRVAPMCERGYMEKLLLFGNLERWSDVIMQAKLVIPMLYSADDLALAHYRLAFAYWRSGDLEAALASYVCTEYHPDVAAETRDEMLSLMSEMGRHEPPSLSEAKSIMQSRGIERPITTSDKRLAAYLIVTLMDNGFAPLTEHLMLLLSTISNDIYQSVYHSIRNGVPESA